MSKLRQALQFKKLRSLGTRRVLVRFLLVIAPLLHIFLFFYFLDEHSAASRRADDLRSKILADAGVVNSWILPEVNSAIAKSPRKDELEALQSRENALSVIEDIFAATFPIWPILFLIWGVLIARRFWRAENLPSPVQRLRRERVLLAGVLLNALALAGLITAWRYFSTGLFIETFYRWLTFALLVLFVGVCLVELFWRLISIGRFQSRLSSFPLSSKRIPQAMVLAAVAWAALSDLERVQELILNSGLSGIGIIGGFPSTHAALNFVKCQF